MDTSESLKDSDTHGRANDDRVNEVARFVSRIAVSVYKETCNPGRYDIWRQRLSQKEENKL